VGGVDDLVLGRQPLVDEAEQVFLGPGVQRQARLVQQQDEARAAVLL
jgi:hypothetical protein